MVNFKFILAMKYLQLKLRFDVNTFWEERRNKKVIIIVENKQLTIVRLFSYQILRYKCTTSQQYSTGSKQPGVLPPSSVQAEIS